MIWKGLKRNGYSCATSYSRPLQDISRQPNDKNDFIRMETGIGSMLKSGNKRFLFIVKADDYPISAIPEGAFYMRERGFFTNPDGSDYGHGVTLAEKRPDGIIVFNNFSPGAIGPIEEEYDSFIKRYQYIGWPQKLGYLYKGRTSGDETFESKSQSIGHTYDSDVFSLHIYRRYRH